MPTYLEELAATKTYKGNVVIRMGGVYYAIRKPDSGLDIPLPQAQLVETLVLNPTQISPKNVTTTIASNGFKLLDRRGAVSEVVKDTGADLMGTEVEIWLGRSDVGMDFADYFKLPSTRISKISKSDAGYTFATREYTDRMLVPIYAAKGRLQGTMFVGSTSIVSKDSIAAFPTAGFIRIDNEIIEYTGKSGDFTFTGCLRGVFGTTAHEASDNTDIEMCETITDNPINIILKLILSNGGGSAYDVLNDGLGIGQALIDIAGIEAIRDELFDDVADFSLALYDIESALKYIEAQLLAPCNLRFSFSSNSKLTLAVLDQAVFVPEDDVIDHDSIIQHPTLDIAASEIVNRLNIKWDFDEGTQTYRESRTFDDADSISTYGLCSSPLSFEFKGVSDDDFVTDLAAALLSRIATPTPQVSVRTQLNKSTLNIGSKTILETNRLANENGELAFASSMEVVGRSINYQNGEVTMKLAYTSFTGIRTCWICPSDTIDAVISQKKVTAPAGMGALYAVGWKMRLWDNVAGAYTADAVNTITEVDGDDITFENDFVTALTTDHRLKFADYDEVVPAQHRYCFISPTGLDFQDGGKSYKIIP